MHFWQEHQTGDISLTSHQVRGQMMSTWLLTGDVTLDQLGKVVSGGFSTKREILPFPTLLIRSEHTMHYIEAVL